MYLRNNQYESEVILMRKTKVKQLRGSTREAYIKNDLEKKGVSFKRYFRWIKDNYTKDKTKISQLLKIK